MSRVHSGPKGGKQTEARHTQHASSANASLHSLWTLLGSNLGLNVKLLLFRLIESSAALSSSNR